MAIGRGRWYKILRISMQKIAEPVFSFQSHHGRANGLLSIPHSGEVIASEFTPHLLGSTEHWAQDVDTHVDKLVDQEAIAKVGVGILIAHMHRITTDLNRSRDRALFAWPLNTHGVKIIGSRPSSAEEERLLGKYYDPYYEILRSALGELHHQNPNKKIPFIDLHSMPSKPTAYHLKQNPNQGLERKDFCISDLVGKSCSLQFIQRARELFEAEGFSVAINDPYVGGHITQYVATLPSMQNIQIEINRRLYMNETDRNLNTNALNSFRPILTRTLISLYQEFAP